MGNPTKTDFYDDFAALRKKVHGKDKFIDAISVHGNPNASHATRLQRTPEWVGDDRQIEIIIDRMFPRWREGSRQLRQAIQYYQVFRLYFRVGLTEEQTSAHSGFSVAKVRRIVNGINRVRRGLTVNGRPRKKAGRGRPRKQRSFEVDNLLPVTKL
jgi:hypothetical protein